MEILNIEPDCLLISHIQKYEKNQEVNENKTFYISLTSLLEKLIKNIKDKNNNIIGEFRFITKDEYTAYKPYYTYDINEPERTIIVVKLWLYMIFKKAYTFKHITNEYLEIIVKYRYNQIPDVIICVNKQQYDKLYHPKNIGQFPEINTLDDIKNEENDLLIKVFINEKDLDVQTVKICNENKWIEICLQLNKLNYYMFKFNPFVF
jgi:hypothetical protein